MMVRTLLRLLAAGLLGVCAAVLVSCASSGKGLIPVANAGPLQSDFQAVAQAAGAGNGDCTATEAALSKTERDLRALPATVDGGLRGRLEEGVENLRSRALTLCAQPLAPATTTTETTTTTTPTSTTKTPPTPTTSTTATTPTSTAPTPTTAQPPGTGGAQAPGLGNSESPSEESAAGGPPEGTGDSENSQNGGTGLGGGGGQ